MNKDDDKPIPLDDASLQGSDDRPRDPDMLRRLADDAIDKVVVPINPDIIDEERDLKMISSYGDDFHNYTVALAMKYGATREISIAQTKIDEAVMWLLKFVAGREGA